MAAKILQPKKRGRPRTGIGTPVQVRMNDALLASLDHWRQQQPDRPNRPEAMRRLVEQGLTATKPLFRDR
jgi:hypothetical protein